MNHLLSRRLWLTSCFLELAGCKSAQQSRPMPAQKRPPSASDPGSYVNFNQPDADECIVRDINPGDGRRWTRDHPEMKFWVRREPGLRFSMTLWIAEATLRDTGPVTLTVKINGNVLGSIRCSQARNYRFEQPVPLDWVRPGEPVFVLAEASPLWTAPRDGAHLGYLLEEAGFRW